MVGSCDDNRIDRRVVQHAANIADGTVRAGAFLRLLPSSFVWIANISHVGDLPECLEQTGAAASAADDSHGEPLVDTT